MRALTLSLPLLFAAAAPLQAQDHDPFGLVSEDGDAPVVVHDGQRSVRLVAGREVAAPELSGLFAAGACAGLSESFLSADMNASGDVTTAAEFTPDGTKLVTANLRSKNLVVFDAATQTVSGVIPVSGSPVHFDISPSGLLAVTANLFEDTASIVDLVTLAEIAVVAVGDQPAYVRFTPGGGTVVVGNAVDQSLSVIDVGTQTETFRIPGTGFQSTTSIAFEPGVITTKVNGFVCPSDTLAVHADNLNDEIDFFDLSAGTVTSVASAADPRGIAMTPDGATVVVSHTFSARTISVIDTATQTITKTIPTAVDLNEPITVRPDGTKAVVAIQNAALVVDLVVGTFSPSLNTASINQLLTTADGLHALCVGFRGALISYASDSVVKELNNVVSTSKGAVSPVGMRAAMAADLFGENLLFVNTNGAAGFLEANVPNGPAAEADATRKLELSADGSVAVATNILSDTASVIDTATGAVLAVVDVGDRPSDVAITPDASKAVVANLDSTFASVIDLNTFVVTNVAISTRASEVEISPDGQYAYLAVVASGDGVWRIDLSTNSVAGPKLPTGNMGGTFYLFNQASGMTLSHDGATLAVCGSFDDVVTLIDTASWSLKATSATGAFPTEAAFAPDDSALYVANKNDDTISSFNAAGGPTGTIAVGDQPGEMVVSPDGGTLYVCNFLDDEIGVVDTALGLMTATLPTPDNPQDLALSPAGSCLISASGTWSVTLGPGPKISIGLGGALRVFDTGTLATLQTVSTGVPPGGLSMDASGTTFGVPSPFTDELVQLDAPARIATYCTSKVNSDGCAAPIGSSGTPSASAGSGFDVTLSQVIAGSVGLYFYSTTGPAAIPFQGGFLCLAVPVTRTPGQNSGGSGPCGGSFSIDFNAYVASGADPALVAGADFWGQYWSRDPASPSTTHLSDALTGTLQP